MPCNRFTPEEIVYKRREANGYYSAPHLRMSQFLGGRSLPGTSGGTLVYGLLWNLSAACGIYSLPKPASRARMAACTRSATCSLLKMLET